MSTIIIWFRQDLRLTDNLALHTALEQSSAVIPVYIYAPHEHRPWSIGAASQWWLHHSLAALAQALHAKGSKLIIRAGKSDEILKEIARDSGADRVFFNASYEPSLLARDERVTQSLLEDGIHVSSFNSTLLFEPCVPRTQLGGPFKVFNGFWNACQRIGLDARTVPAPKHMPDVAADIFSAPLDTLELLPKIRWDRGLQEEWQPGEEGASERLEKFCEFSLARYADNRDFPAKENCSKLSPHLHFGEIGPRQIIARLEHWLFENAGGNAVRSVEIFKRELIWREFAYHVLYHFPSITHQSLDKRFGGFAWRPDSQSLLAAWQQGRTGYPMVDAGLRQLWLTGWMHNRVRMIVASFLTKNCRIPWQDGTRWFWDTLVDADLANNSFNWQWVAGCGADAVPYFRIFNPITQGMKFDAEGNYVRRWVPELARLPNRWLHQPWLAPGHILNEAKVRLGIDYPEPVINLTDSRIEALAAFESIKRSRG